MGFYIELPENKKQGWMQENALNHFLISGHLILLKTIPDGCFKTFYPVVYLQNPTFAVLAIAYSKKEYTRLLTGVNRRHCVVGFFMKDLLEQHQPHAFQMQEEERENEETTGM